LKKSLFCWDTIEEMRNDFDKESLTSANENCARANGLKWLAALKDTQLSLIATGQSEIEKENKNKARKRN